MFTRTNFRMILTLVCLAAVLFAASSALACPTCKDGMEANDPEHAGMVQGYFYSILFMMGMPYLTLTGFGIYMYRKVRQARAQQAAQAAANAAESVSAAHPAEQDRELVEI